MLSLRYRPNPPGLTVSIRWVSVSIVSALLSVAALADAELALPVPDSAELLSERSSVGTAVLLLSAAERIRRDLVIDHKEDIEGTHLERTYELDRSQDLDALTDRFATALDVVLFRCSARDCGRSNVWANEIVGNPLLFGPDREQRYVAGVIGEGEAQRLVSVYLVQRGNLRRYLRLQVMNPTTPRVFDTAQSVSEALLADGFAIHPTVRPLADGSLTASDSSELGALGAALASAAPNPIYVVCHVYASAGSSSSLLASQRCADTAVEQLSTTAGNQAFVAFGAGSLMPRPERTHSRLELVLPGRLSRD